MKVVIISKVLEPFTTGNTATHLAKLSGSLVTNEHNISVIMPIPDDIEQKGLSLARRLSKITVNHNDQEHKFIRFDSKTPSGVDVHLLSHDGEQDGFDSALFSKAAEQMVQLMDEKQDIAVSWGCEFDIFNWTNGPSKKIGTIDNEQATTDKLDKYNSIIVVGDALTQKLLSQKESSLGKKLRKGETFSVSDTNNTKPEADFNKSSVKTQIQNKYNLPNNHDTQLFYFCDNQSITSDDQLITLLKQDIQIITHKNDNLNLDKILETFPDRLAVVNDETPINELLQASDFSVHTACNSLINLSLHFGCIPITADNLSSEVIQLDPHLTSGSGIIFKQNNQDSLYEATGFAAGLTGQINQLKKLTTRLPEYAIFLDKTINKYEKAFNC